MNSRQTNSCRIKLDTYSFENDKVLHFVLIGHLFSVGFLFALTSESKADAG